MSLAAPALHAAGAQEPTRGLDLTVNGTGISIGDSRGVNGLRLNFRDIRLDRVNYAWNLHGVQIGLINHARNNRHPFRWLPILNVHVE
jgi:hypothetical protein